MIACLAPFTFPLLVRLLWGIALRASKPETLRRFDLHCCIRRFNSGNEWHSRPLHGEIRLGCLQELRHQCEVCIA